MTVTDSQSGYIRVGILVAALAALPIGTGALAHGEAAHAMDGTMSMDAGYERSVRSIDVPDLHFTDQNGRQVSLQELLAGSDSVLLNFIYTTCTTVCPVLAAGFSNVQGAGAEAPRLVSISIDPEHDTPAALKAYARRYRAGDDWSLLTGSLKDTIAVQKRFDAFRGDKMNHLPLLFLRRGELASSWLRVDGFPSSSDVIEELRVLGEAQAAPDATSRDEENS